MNNYELRVLPKKDDCGQTYFMAFFPAIEGCVGGGDTCEEAIKDAYENLDIYLEYLKDNGYSLPEEYQEDEYSGKLTLRISKSMHKQVAEFAEKEGVSINNYINNCIANHLGKDEYKYKLYELCQNIQQTTEQNMQISYLTAQTVANGLNSIALNNMNWGGF